RFAFELRRAENRRKIASRDADRAALAFGNAHRGITQRLTDLTFQAAHAGFARVVLDDLAYLFVVDFNLTGFARVCLPLAPAKITSHAIVTFIYGDAVG